VHAAARDAAMRSDEVLVSRVVTDLVAGAGLKFTERGAFDLKGIPPMDLFAAAHKYVDVQFFWRRHDELFTRCAAGGPKSAKARSRGKFH